MNDIHQSALSRADALYRASRDIGSTLDRGLRPLRLSYARWTVLRALVAIGPMSIQRLADHVGVHRTSARAVLKVLEADGYVHLDDGLDRRRVMISAPARGAEVFDAGQGIIAAMDLSSLAPATG